MMWLLMLALVGIVVVLISQSKRRESRRASASSLVDDPPVVAPQLPRVATSVSSPAERPQGNELQPFSPIPLTVAGASLEAITALRVILEDERVYGRDRQERILEWLLTTNARVQQIDEFIAEWGPKFERAVSALCVADPDWPAAGELDREDIHEGAAKKAVEGFDVRVADLKYEVIARAPTLTATADDELLARYGFESLSFYFRNAEDLDRVHVLPSDDWYRPRFETLVAKGLARRGADVPPEAVLQTMTLKEMEAVAEGVDHRRFTRRAPAVAFLATLPDLRERLGRRVSLRELFQLLPLPAEFADLDLVALGHAWAFAGEYTALLDTTYSTGAQARRAATEAVIDEYARGWSVESSFGDQPCCPTCARQGGERRGTRDAPRLPHHVGCMCHLSQIYG